MRLLSIFNSLDFLHTEIYLMKDDLYFLDVKLCKKYLKRKRLRILLNKEINK